LGGFKFKGKGLIELPVQIPNRKPDFNLTGSTFPGQAFLYRLVADPNPLHIDPKISKTLNFDRPIIHGNKILI
jgi:acyl dehydratase